MGIVENMPAVPDGATAVAVPIGKIVGASLFADGNWVELVGAPHGPSGGIFNMLLACGGT
jgi:hypothetical protein